MCPPICWSAHNKYFMWAMATRLIGLGMGVLDFGGDRRRGRGSLGSEFVASHCNQWGLCCVVVWKCVQRSSYRLAGEWGGPRHSCERRKSTCLKGKGLFLAWFSAFFRKFNRTVYNADMAYWSMVASCQNQYERAELLQAIQLMNDLFPGLVSAVKTKWEKQPNRQVNKSNK